MEVIPEDKSSLLWYLEKSIDHFILFLWIQFDKPHLVDIIFSPAIIISTKPKFSTGFLEKKTAMTILFGMDTD